MLPPIHITGEGAGLGTESAPVSTGDALSSRVGACATSAGLTTGTTDTCIGIAACLEEADWLGLLRMLGDITWAETARSIINGLLNGLLGRSSIPGLPSEGVWLGLRQVAAAAGAA
mmetsp:Transcript_101837/g.296945  ORF Transcript_101837/g.296945 Transcript_101837/m.296945 type:complete len:116 (+) Transcript_101837:552-899(+)